MPLAHHVRFPLTFDHIENHPIYHQTLPLPPPVRRSKETSLSPRQPAKISPRRTIFIPVSRLPDPLSLTQPLTSNHTNRLRPFDFNLSRTFYFFSTLTHLLRLSISPFPSIPFQDLLGLLSSASDELYSFHRLGLVGRSWGDRSNRWVNNLWLISTLIGLSDHSVSSPSLNRQIRSLEAVLESSEEKEEDGLRDRVEGLRKERHRERRSTLKLGAWFA